MAIQWYPGHMHKAQKEMRQLLPTVDMVIEVLDARIPFSSQNPLLASLRGDKPVIKILAKSDLADPENMALWQQHLEAQEGVKTLAVSTESPERIHRVQELCRKLAPANTANQGKVTAMIAGIPNVGKSTLINTLAGRAIAKTGNEPAVTRHQQRIAIATDVLLLDTPGVLWPKQAYALSSYRLALTGAIRETALEYEDLGFFFAEFLLEHYPDSLSRRYGLETLPEETLPLLEKIARLRECLGAGGRADFDKVARLLVNDYRSGVFGRLALETPEGVAQEVELADTQAALAAERKAEAKARRRAAYKKRK